ncbi:AraC family transcriptional regulator [Chryseobacterium sp. T16E-39]|uniref:helix-turn-helix domain-containing protein n=1 Tax=Chryseobacterium sp. T16E-39 TaxID=2015076 RepID=UPI000B5B1245|nr:AraC family transcriptional regulator [Chryseobacterium sp. T16E-39]ASK29647.1 AraC family transcriptional regulator [Chryseobacterium sp. T16E-39]
METIKQKVNRGQDKNVLRTYSYFSNVQAQRNKILLHENFINFLEKGEKVVHYANKATTITDAQFAILSSNNCLMTEKLSVDNEYRSTLFFFSDEVLINFYAKYAKLIKAVSTRIEEFEMPLLVFEKDEFINYYIASLKLIQQKSSVISTQMLQLKFEELMLYLLEKYPKAVLSFQTRKVEEYSDIEIKKAVEKNLTNNLTLDELAFLCHTSISTFKRRFLRIYHMVPSKYFLQKKMETATLLLLQNKNPSEVFYEVGYENHSSFSQSFKRIYGMSPKQFQQQNMNVGKQLLND